MLLALWLVALSAAPVAAQDRVAVTPVTVVDVTDGSLLPDQTPLKALQAATLNPARFFEATESLGTVEEGRLADLVLLDANPLADITNTRRTAAVVLDGRYLDRAALDSLLTEAERSAMADTGSRSTAGTTTGRGGSGGRSGTT